MSIEPEDDLSWIKRALNSIRFGEIIVIKHEDRVVRIDTKERKEVKKDKA